MGRRELSGKGMLHPLAEFPRHVQKRGGGLHAAAGQGGREFCQGRERLSQRVIRPVACRAPREFMQMYMKIVQEPVAIIVGGVIVGKQAGYPVGVVGKVRLEGTVNLLGHFRTFVSGLAKCLIPLPGIPGGYSHDA